MQHSISELKLNILSGVYRIIGRALHLEHAIDDIIGTLTQALPISSAAVILRHRELDRSIFPFYSDSDTGPKVDMQRLYRTVLTLVFRVAQPFVVLDDETKPLFLDRKILYSIKKEQVRLLGTPIVIGDVAAGAIVVDRLFGNLATLEEDIQFLSIIANLIAQIASLELHAKRREEILSKENVALRARLSDQRIGLACLGKSDKIKQLEKMIRKFAPGDAPVLLCGEPGTGKSFIASIIHELSGRAAQPFVTVHCSLPEDLLDEELFGNRNNYQHEGVAPKPTLCDKAKGGALFLNEVGELSLSLQARMVEFIERSESADLRISRTKVVDIRLIASTSGNLAEAVARGTFRRDLLDKLNVLPIQIPPLRERKEDIPFLLKRFLHEACEEHGRKLRPSPQTLKRLSEHDWPGNIGELRKAIIRLVIMAEGTEIKAGDTPTVLEQSCAREYAQPESQINLSRLDEMELKEISAALERNMWIQRRAARDLGLTFRQMNYRIKKFGLGSVIREKRPRSRNAG
ncbi:MAG: sigma 54-interacting transcriptional regulator [Syntrophobacteraceae bacterium]|nr:sigma 54-interacting transcriptional regulator [Syntrophobacteraceae bacterium]